MADGYLPEPPKSNISICSKRYMQKVLIWGKSPRREIAGKQYKNTKKKKKKRSILEHSHIQCMENKEICMTAE